MGKKSKKIKIPKNRDIEEFVEQIESENNSQCKKRPIEDKRQEFKKSIEVSDGTVDVDNKQIERRVKKFSDRRDAQFADHERRVNYLKAMNKVEELNNENEIEIQEFFDDIQRKTDEYLKKQDEVEKKKIDKKYGEKYNIKPVEQKKDKKESKKKASEKRVSGTSMEEILNSQQFKDIWNESQEQEER